MSARRRQQEKIIRLKQNRILREQERYLARCEKEVRSVQIRTRQQIHQEINQIKITHVLTQDHHQILKEFLQSLEETTGYFFSLYVCRLYQIYRKPHYSQTIHAGGLGSRGPIQVNMLGKYGKYSGIYPSVNEFNQNILKPLHSIKIQPTIHTGILVDAKFQPENPIELTIRSHGYDCIESELLGTISFTQKYLNGIKIGTTDQIPLEYLEKLRDIRSIFSTQDTYDFYWVQGLNNCGNLFPYDPINPSLEWSEHHKMDLFQHTLSHRAIKVIFDSNMLYLEKKCVVLINPTRQI